MKKSIKLLCLLLISLSLFSETTALAQDTDVKSNRIIISNYSLHQDKQITTYADVMVWRYKVVKKKLYKRKYNTSKERWEGPWILC